MTVIPRSRWKPFALDVTAYAAAIRSIGCGKFTTRLGTEGKGFFATVYAAPFFARSLFAAVQCDVNSTTLRTGIHLRH